MRFQTALFLVSALATTGAAQAQGTSTVPDATQKTVTGLYQAVCNAVQDPTDKNLDAAFAEMAPGFVAIDPKGKQHQRDEVVASQRMMLKQIEADDCTTTFQSVSAPDANTLVVVATTHVTGTMQGQDGKHKLDATDKNSDTWKLQNGTWLETQSKSVSVVVKVDGTVVQDTGN